MSKFLSYEDRLIIAQRLQRVPRSERLAKNWDVMGGRFHSTLVRRMQLFGKGKNDANMTMLMMHIRVLLK